MKVRPTRIVANEGKALFAEYNGIWWRAEGVYEQGGEVEVTETVSDPVVNQAVRSKKLTIVNLDPAPTGEE